jgi:hypothetical protein
MTEDLLKVEHGATAPEIVQREGVPEGVEVRPGGAKPSCSHRSFIPRRAVMRRI